jgi:tetraacyldisaccharide 4'-kinase
MRQRTSLPTVAVGNLTVGGSGKSPIASWIGRYYAVRGFRPAVLLRGYMGSDEGTVHSAEIPGGLVIENPDRIAAARAAASQGAHIVILDDAYQRLDMERDLDIVIVAAESFAGVRWLLPAGPWREPLSALRRAHVVIVTRKRSDRMAARAVAEEVARHAPQAKMAIAHLRVVQFRGLRSDRSVSLEELRDRRVIVATAIGDPLSFAQQCSELGADIRLLAWRDHHEFTKADVRRILQGTEPADYVVVTEKDAVKLKSVWPVEAREPLVARLEIKWELGLSRLEEQLERLATVSAGVDPRAGSAREAAGIR